MRCASLYGMTLFGQACLAARRLVEAGTRFVTRLLGRVRPGRQRLGHALGPLPADEERAAAAASTAPVRADDRPRPARHAGRDAGGVPQRARPHAADRTAPRAAAAITGRGPTRPAGRRRRGARPGRRRDRQRSPATSAERPVSPKDMLATMYHLLGIDPHDAAPRPHRPPVPLVPEVRSGGRDAGVSLWPIVTPAFDGGTSSAHLSPRRSYLSSRRR